MISRDLISRQLQYTLNSIDIPALGKKISGKVRDSYVKGDTRFLITSDRLSAFDRILTTIPFKGRLLNETAIYWFDETKHIIANHIIDQPHPNVLVARQVEIIPIEVVVRGFLTGSAWRDYQAGSPVSGIMLDPGLRKSEQFETPLLTPSTKAAHGEHDLPISSAEIVSSGLVKKALWDQISETALELYRFGNKLANQRGLILVDTKYEFGLRKDKSGKESLVLADEIHTQDSSRYWMLASYQERFSKDEDPDMLDKEFVRRWLMQQGYMGEGTPPEFTDEFRVETAEKYISAFEKITGRKFSATPGPIEKSIEESLKKFF